MNKPTIKNNEQFPLLSLPLRAMDRVLDSLNNKDQWALQHTRRDFADTINAFYARKVISMQVIPLSLLTHDFFTKHPINYHALYQTARIYRYFIRRQVTTPWQLCALLGDVNHLDEAISLDSANAYRRLDDVKDAFGWSPLHYFSMSAQDNKLPYFGDYFSHTDLYKRAKAQCNLLASMRGDAAWFGLITKHLNGGFQPEDSEFFMWQDPEQRDIEHYAAMAGRTHYKFQEYFPFGMVHPTRSKVHIVNVEPTLLTLSHRESPFITAAYSGQWAYLFDQLTKHQLRVKTLEHQLRFLKAGTVKSCVVDIDPENAELLIRVPFTRKNLSVGYTLWPYPIAEFSQIKQLDSLKKVQALHEMVSAAEWCVKNPSFWEKRLAGRPLNLPTFQLRTIELGAIIEQIIAVHQAQHENRQTTILAITDQANRRLTHVAAIEGEHRLIKNLTDFNDTLRPQLQQDKQNVLLQLETKDGSNKDVIDYAIEQQQLTTLRHLIWNHDIQEIEKRPSYQAAEKWLQYVIGINQALKKQLASPEQFNKKLIALWQHHSETLVDVIACLQATPKFTAILNRYYQNARPEAILAFIDAVMDQKIETHAKQMWSTSPYLDSSLTQLIFCYSQLQTLLHQEHKKVLTRYHSPISMKHSSKLRLKFTENEEPVVDKHSCTFAKK